MARDQKQRQKKLARNAAKRKAKRKVLASHASAQDGPSMSGVGKWPLLECLISPNWEDTMSLCQILVARQAPSGYVGTGTFLMDLGCLGLKNGFLSRFHSTYEYESTLKEKVQSRMDMMPCDIALAAKVLAEGVEYAGKLGFAPDKDGRRALKILGDANPDDCTETISLGGDDGKPFFMSGPYDNVPRIMAILERTVGKDGFDLIASDGPPPEFFD